MENYICRKLEYCLKMPIRQGWEQTAEALFHFILLWNALYVKALWLWVSGRKSDLLKVNLEQRKQQKHHVVCSPESFLRD